jgi:hypothetical protein
VFVRVKLQPGAGGDRRDGVRGTGPTKPVGYNQAPVFGVRSPRGALGNSGGDQ